MVLEISCMLVCLPTRMDLCLRVVKLGFRAFGLNIRGSYWFMEKSVVVYFVMGEITYRLDVMFLGSNVLGDGPCD
jgi:hypothetical protein